MADLIGTEKDAKDISGANVVVEDKKCVTKARALEIGAAVENDSSYANNLLVCLKDLKANIRFYGYSVLNPNFLQGSYDFDYDTYPLITKNYLLSKSANDLLYGHKKCSTFTYNGSKIVNSNVQVDILWAISGNVIWGITRNKDDKHIYCYYDTIDSSGNFTPTLMITITESTYTLGPISCPWALGDNLYFFTYTSSSSTLGAVAMYIYKVSHTSGNYTRTNVSLSFYGYYDGTLRTYYPKFSWPKSLPNRNGVFLFANNVDADALGNGKLTFMLVDYIKLRTSAIHDLSAELPMTIANYDIILNDWIDDGTINGSWLVTYGRNLWSARLNYVFKITNLSFSSGGTVSYTNLTSTYSSFTGRNGETLSGFTFAWDKKRSRFYIIGFTSAFLDNKFYLYTSTNLTSFSYVRDLDALSTAINASNYHFRPCLYMNVSPDGEYLIMHGSYWSVAFELTSGNYNMTITSVLTESEIAALGVTGESSNVDILNGRFSTPDIHQGPACNPNGHDYVDLGLPSGTLWARTNVGATYEYQVGSTYSFSVTGSPSSANVYNGLHNSWGGDWKIPSQALWAELIANTTVTSVTQGGQACAKVSSRFNGSYILLPLNLNSNTYAYYPSQDISSGGWYAYVQSTVITSPQSAFGGELMSPVRGVLLPNRIDF